ncbi:hypothetical protein TVAG_305310 [Trichomonas vaginalis G3]|uniref:Uncharacterized protein n=1 Tax=Trichomonas vaginalis (strain ATCC PRA-98 / G3) TaxID=412133 RepID=A2ERA6_TRIV3|nr:hypothetical protein TVAGG3_1003780 [Trichomonas vaginalis G3]EAY04782.1 hypothetical protein TVAG_305310 [Trichomonas vaginalis G3]KAI5490983.1 hypothetical protein TVAGG3_1003780 [Trichomonas vaginalis G3]|eukprot:XP_001317005.1 hypothetical protein [Trichomonas vaginalis G3]
MNPSSDMTMFFQNVKDKIEQNSTKSNDVTQLEDTIQNIEKDCSVIDIHLNEMKDSAQQIYTNLGNIYKVSSKCQYHASVARVSFQNIAEATTRPSFFSRTFHYIAESVTYISNLMTAIYYQLKSTPF